MHITRSRIVTVTLLSGACALILLSRLTGANQAAQEQVNDTAFFEKEVLPVLKANCFKCHGDGKTKGGLSLATREGLVKGGDTGPAISLDRPEESLLLKAINHAGDLEMPPPPAAKLAKKEIEAITRWVKAGVPGLPEKAVAGGKKASEVTDKDRHYWAYKPVQRPDLPAVKNKAWGKNSVDAFILAGLEAKGLTPAAPADRRALARRVYYDLIGLPPTPEEIDAFVNDKAADAYEQLVDKLLDSPHYGEKWARHWLDLVRYGETNGYEFDQPKPFIWRYRDWVIDAFNQDMPYDQFVREQIAGDLLGPVTAESAIATGYYRLGQWDSGAADRVQQKYDVLDSIVSTTGQVFLGMSMGCARCHDHKADPILQRDYYRLLAFFHNIGDPGAKTTKRFAASAAAKDQDKLLKEKQQGEIELSRRIYQLEQRFAIALAAKKGIKISDLPASDLMELTYRFYRDTWERLPEFDSLLPETEGPIASNFFTLAPASRAEAIGLVFEGKLKVLQEGEYTFYLESTDGARLTIDGKAVLDRPNKGRQSGEAKVRLRAELLPVRLEYFNSYDKPHLQVEWSGPGVPRRPLSAEAGKDKTDLAALIRSHGAEALSEKETQLYFKWVAELAQSRQAKPGEIGIQVSCVVESGSAPTYLLARGNPKVKGEQVEPGFPEVLLKAKQAAAAEGRPALARWLTDAKNPLPARVMVNRLWQHHFGRGIVPTPNDFGKLGEPPTHPELLDWLASAFVAGGWKMKPMHRLLMTSSAYRMSSKADPKALRVDPVNSLLWRFNMRRLTAEEVRDSILAMSGRLNLKMAGPGVYPPIPREVLAGQARPGTGWKPSPPEEAARRSVYVHVKRSLLVPILAQFDQADTDASCPVRFTTTVPTQALGLLNDDFSNTEAKVFALRLTKEVPPGLEAQVARAIRLTTGRVPGAEELRKDVAFVRDLQQQNNLGELEALRFYCLLVLNTNEFLYLD
jgi:mono/diheme cytochrome c family protein